MQQIPFVDLFIDLFEFALHVSGDKLARPQEYVLIVCTAFGTMHRCCWRPVTKVRRSSISTLSPVGSNIGALYQKLYIQSKSTLEDGRVCRAKHVEEIQIDQ